MPIEQPVFGYKFLAAVVAFISPVMAFFLGLQFMPLDEKDPHDDMVRRLSGCVASSFVLGAFVLLWLRVYHPEAFVAAEALGAALGAKEVGTIWLVGAVLLVCGLPGWLLVGAAFRSMKKLEGKTLGEAAQDLRRSVVDVAADRD